MYGWIFQLRSTQPSRQFFHPQNPHLPRVLFVLGWDKVFQKLDGAIFSSYHMRRETYTSVLYGFYKRRSVNTASWITFTAIGCSLYFKLGSYRHRQYGQRVFLG